MTAGGLSLCLLALLAVTTSQGAENLLNNLQDEPSPQVQVPLDFFMLHADNDIALMFGFEVIEQLRIVRMNCVITRGQEELEFNDKIKDMTDYYRQTEQLLSDTDLRDLKQAIRDSIRQNFRDAFIQVEDSRNNRLKDMRGDCDNLLDGILSNRKQQAIDYAQYLIERNPSDFAKFLFEVSGYARQIQDSLQECQDYYVTLESAPGNQGIGDPFDLCYGTEINMLVDFITLFLAEADAISQQRFGEEDNAMGGEGGNDDGYMSEPTATIDPVDLYDGRYDYYEDGYIDDYWRQGDDEDYDTGESGDNYEYTSKPTPIIDPVYRYDNNDGVLVSKPQNEKPDEKEEEKEGNENVRLPDPGPIFMDPTENKPTTVTIPPSTETKPTDGEDPEESKPNEKPTSTKEEEEALNEFINNLEPGPVILEDLSTSSPTSDVTDPIVTTVSEGVGSKEVTDATTEASEPTEASPPDWLKETFDELMDDQKQAEEDAEASRDESKSDSSDETSDSSDGSKSTKSHYNDDDDDDDDSNDNDGVFEGDIEIDIPGVGIGIDVEIGEDGITIDAEFSDDDDTISDPEEHGDKENEEDGSVSVSYFFTYFFVTIGVLVVLAVTMISLGVVISRRRNSREKSGYSPLLSEDDKISVMKQSGYINPTYKFFDQATSI